MAVTAKIRCNDKQVTGEDEGRQARVGFGPDYQDDRNKEWAAATPTLSLQMVLNGSVIDRFEIGRTYTLTFTESD